jgi:hypothetical protein
LYEPEFRFLTTDVQRSAILSNFDHHLQNECVELRENLNRTFARIDDLVAQRNALEDLRRLMSDGIEKLKTSRSLSATKAVFNETYRNASRIVERAAVLEWPPNVSIAEILEMKEVLQKAVRDLEYISISLKPGPDGRIDPEMIKAAEELGLRVVSPTRESAVEDERSKFDDDDAYDDDDPQDEEIEEEL